MSSFPKRAMFHKGMGALAMMLVLVSMAVIALKECTSGIVSDSEARRLVTGESVRRYLASYFYPLHALHGLSLAASLLVVLLSCVNLVPKNDDDIKFAFHFLSIFVVFGVGMATIYASFIAFQRPCTGTGECCSIQATPGLLSSSEKAAITSISLNDQPMLAVMTMDLVAGLVQLVIAFVYFRDVRREAEKCGYLYRVHNEGYIIR